MRKATKTQTVEVPARPPLLDAVREIDNVKEHVFPAEPPARLACRICAAPDATQRSEGLCWVCWRLKISAWQGAEAQDSASDG